MEINIVGIGMNGIGTLTADGKNAVERAELLIGAKRMIEPFISLGKPYIISYNTAEICQIIEESSFDSISVLMSGDCGFFSGAKSLSDRLSSDDVKIISGISTPVYFCSKLAKNWNDVKFISLHGADNNIAVNVKLNRKCFFLMGGKVTVSDLCRTLYRYGLGNVMIHVGQNLGYENELILSEKAEKLMNFKGENLTCVLTENENYINHDMCGIEDEEFVRGEIPMTKSEVRGISVSKLKIRKDDICWDIGCGTGSVSVEMALKCSNGKVFSFDKKTEAVELTIKNSEKFSCDNISVYNCELPDIPKNDEILPPDKVFIGGSSGKTDDIINLVLSRNPDAVIVINAVTIETLNSSAEKLKKANFETDITQISVTRTRKAGGSTMFSAQNPVFIIKGERK